MIARWNSPLAEGIASSVATLRPPPDWPKMVTVFGSPPNWAMLSRTHFERVHDVEHAHVARLRELRAAELAEVREAEHVEPVIDGDDDHVAAAREVGRRR